MKYLSIFLAVVMLFTTALPALSMTDEEIAQEIQSLKDRISQLEQVLQERKTPQQEAALVEEPAAEEPETTETEPEASTPAAGRALQLPDISLVGNVIGLGTDNDKNPDQNQFTLKELEVAFQGWVYPNIRADVILAAESEEDFAVGLEEGYATITSIGSTRFGSKLGKLRAPIGKWNQYHPHQLPYADTPAVASAFLTDHGVIVQGAELNYLFPGDNFVNLEFGQWRPTMHAHEHEDEHEGEDLDHLAPVMLEGTTRIARLWTSRALGDLSEVELGASLADSPDDQIYGVDLTYKHWPSAFKRLYLLGELLFDRGKLNGDSDTKYGYYLLGAYQPDKYWEYGARYDWTEFPFPLNGRESAGTVFLTRRLNETTFARLQYKRSDNTDFGIVNDVYLQFVFGLGPHAHPLQ